jgi:hypothetical protein
MQAAAKKCPVVNRRTGMLRDILKVYVRDNTRQSEIRQDALQANQAKPSLAACSTNFLRQDPDRKYKTGTLDHFTCTVDS